MSLSPDLGDGQLKRERLRFSALLLLCTLYFAYAFWVGSRQGYSLFICPFHWLTGIPCPLCGLTHALGALLHGQVQRAFSFNRFGLLLTAGCLVWLARAGAIISCGAYQLWRSQR